MAWLHVPSLGSPSAPVSEASTSDLSLPWEGDIELWPTSSGTPMQRPASWRGWKTRPWVQLLSGTISRPSLAAIGAAEWTSSLRGIPASRFPAPEAERAPKTRAISGLTFAASSAKYDRATSSWRTSEGTFPWASTECSVTLPASGSMRSGQLSEHRALALRTVDVKGREGGASLPQQVSTWPTPTSGDSKASGAAGYSTESGRHSGTTLTDATCGPPAPKAPRHSDPHRPALNPRFVESLMGFPVGWTSCLPHAPTDYAAWETPLSRFRQRWRSELLRLECRASNNP